MKVIGITGKIGSGKTTVIKYLQALGYTVLIEDEIATHIRESYIVQENITAYFGKIMTKEDLKIAIRHDNKVLDYLNALIHPMVFDYVSNYIESSNDDFVFVESAIPDKARFNELCDCVWLITSAPEARFKRVTKTRNITKDDFLLFDSKQTFNNINNVIEINNFGTVDNLYKKIDNLLD